MGDRAHNFIDLTGRVYGRLTVIALHSIVRKQVRWFCKCGCGAETIKLGENLKVGGTTSCGCRKLETSRLEKGESGFNKLYATYIKGAQKRGLEFSLDRQQFKLLTKQPCHYCGTAPYKPVQVINPGRTSIVGAEYSTYVYNGIDRKDNVKGYTIDNSLPCCLICNRAKSNLTYEEFLFYIARIRNGL